MSTRSALTIFALGFLAFGATLMAAATTASASFGVTVTVQASCRTTTNAMAFKTYAAAALNPTPPVSVTCSNSVPYSVSVTPGTGLAALAVGDKPGFSVALPRYVAGFYSGGFFSRGQTLDTALVTGNGTRFAQAIVGYDPLPQGPHVAAGNFFDTMIVTY